MCFDFAYTNLIYSLILYYVATHLWGWFLSSDLHSLNFNEHKSWTSFSMQNSNNIKEIAHIFSFAALDLKSLFKRLIVCKHVLHGWLVRPNTYLMKNVVKSTQSDILLCFLFLIISVASSKRCFRRGGQKECCRRHLLFSKWFDPTKLLVQQQQRTATKRDEKTVSSSKSNDSNFVESFSYYWK